MTFTRVVGSDKSSLRDSQIAPLELVRLMQTRRRLNVAFLVRATVSYKIMELPSASNSDIPSCNIGLKTLTSLSSKFVKTLACVLFSNDAAITDNVPHRSSSSKSRRNEQIGRISDTQRSIRIFWDIFRDVRIFGNICDFDICVCRDNNSLLRIFETLSDRSDDNETRSLFSCNPAKHNSNTSAATVGRIGLGTRSTANNVVSSRIFVS
jgi:hypothetical protein